MKRKIIKNILYVIFGMLCAILLLPGKNKTPYIACFETKPLAYRSFRNISYTPKLMLATTYIFKYPKGKWKVPAKAGIYDLIKLFSNPNELEKYHKFTIIEGMNKFDVISLIHHHNTIFSNKLVHENEEVYQIEEGTLFPDTYHLQIESSSQEVIKQAQKLMQKKVDQLWLPLEELAQKYQIKLPITKKEFIILASIVQKEGAAYDDLYKIAGCFLQRLQIGIRLHSCATVLYGLKEINHKIHRNKDNIPIVLTSDTKIKTPYNTYLIERLPPTAICMPGMDAMQAVAQVIETALHDTYNANKKGKKLVYKNTPLYFYACQEKGKVRILYANHIYEHHNNIRSCKLILNKK